VPAVAQLRIDVHRERRAALAADVRRGLTVEPTELPAKWCSDERGSAPVEEITRPPKYDLAARERSILREVGGEIGAAATGESAEWVALAYPGLEVHGVVGDFERGLHSFPPRGRRVLRGAFAAGEELRTELSAKVQREGLPRELAEAGFRSRCADGDFSLSRWEAP
jgi:uncharacterized SAM-dependent methyltransferase